jgi:Leucine-rich repeat (LRR) protein
LYLSRNHLQTLPKEIFQNLTELERLALRDNPGLEPPAVCNNTYCDGP